MTTSSPTMYITKDDEEQWIFKTVSFLRTTEISFKLDEPYEETMPNGEDFEVSIMKYTNLGINPIPQIHG